MKAGILLIALSMILTGCFAEYQPRRGTKQKMKSETDTKKIIDDLMKNDDSLDDYVYTSENRKDPFKSMFMEIQGEIETGPTLEEDRPQRLTSGIIIEQVSELQRFDIDELKLTAIIYGTSARRAVLVDPAQKSHIVREGQIVGRNFGRISSIKRNSIVVQEETYDMQRRKINRDVVVMIDKQNQ